MTVNSIDSTAEFVTNGVTTNYPFFFKFLANEDLVVTYVDPLGVSSILTFGTQYTVNGVGNDSGGSIVTSTALAGPGQLVVSREMEAFQQTSLRNQGKFLAETHEDVFDKLTMLIQQGLSTFKRALIRPLGRDYFFAENRRITSVADPVEGQDAANKRWSMTYIANLLSSITGPINNALNILYLQGLPGSVARTVQSALRDAVVSEQDFASVQDALNGIGKQKRSLRLGGRTVTLGSIPSNQFGTRIEDGKLLVPSLIAGQVTQLNTYADDVSGLFVGRENLAWFWKGLTIGTPFKVYMYGDSTVELNVGYPKQAHELLAMAFQDAGINNATIINRGVSGTSWSDLNATPDISPTTWLYVIKYGINDASKPNPLETLMADARSKLTAIRAIPYGGVRALSILLMGPNSTYGPTFNQDAKWYEDLRNGYLQLCKEFDCAYFDTYAYLQQTKNAPGFWMDDLSGIGRPGEGLHPDIFSVYWLYRSAIRDFVLGDGGFSTIKANTNWNLSNATKIAYSADDPSKYEFGMTRQFAAVANGWPFDGHLLTEKAADGATSQVLKTLDVVPRTCGRRGINTIWTQFYGVPIMVSAFLNSWTNKGGGYADAGYQIGDDGFVEIFGVVTGGGTSSVIFTLPVGARPASAHAYPASGGGMVLIYASGEVSTSGVTPTTLGLDGIRFKAL